MGCVCTKVCCLGVFQLGTINVRGVVVSVSVGSDQCAFIFKLGGLVRKWWW